MGVRPAGPHASVGTRVQGEAVPRLRRGIAAAYETGVVPGEVGGGSVRRATAGATGTTSSLKGMG